MSVVSRVRDEYRCWQTAPWLRAASMDVTALCFLQVGRCGLTSSLHFWVQRGIWGTPMVLGAFVGTAPWDEERFRDPFGRAHASPSSPQSCGCSPGQGSPFFCVGLSRQRWESGSPGRCFLYENVTLGDLSPILAKTSFLYLSDHPVRVHVQYEA